MDKNEFEEIRRKAEQGDAEEQFILGNCYHEGDGVKKSLKEAARWYRKAAMQGDVDGQFCLASSYALGEGVTQNSHKAFTWYKKAALQGDAEAQFVVGECYIYGLGVDIDDAKAVEWYRKAAAQGFEGAKKTLQQIKDGKKLKILNMVLRKEYAIEMVRGVKVREYRAFTEFWVKRLCLFEDPNDKRIATGVKWFDRIHFYPYNNKWFVDCSIEKLEWVTVDKAFLEKYQDEVIANIGDVLFVIHLGKVLATNLEV